MMTRHSILLAVLATAAFALVFGHASIASAQSKYVFEEIPYAYDALEPHIDAKTMEIHYSRHHKGYFDKMLAALEGNPKNGEPIESILKTASGQSDAVRNNAGGHYNHSLFWKVLSPKGGGVPGGDLAKAIDASFGSFADFQKTFNQAAATRFGSGWAWLSVDCEGKLFVSSTPNQDNPLMDVVEQRGTPILGLDVWEHAYYLNYQNKRGSYIDAFWNVVNWPEVERRYAEALKSKASK
ncbi:MAG: superoxide dismutase [Myxococcota bacterium]|jgi:Fe-Mn family superoxide dismutase|nr:superoxide dismutase [Myxococcota bacterium]